MKKQSGLSLIELMIGVVISLFLTAVVATIFFNTKGVFKQNVAISRVQEGGRFAVELLQHDIRLAGFTGCPTVAPTPVNTLNTGNYFYDFTNPITGYDKVSGGWSPTLNTAISSLSPAPTKGDVVTIRLITDSGIYITPPYMSNTSADLHVDAPNTIQQFDILLVTDCIASAIIQESGANPGTSGSVTHNTGVGTPGNSTTNMGHIFQNDAMIVRLISNTYYIAPSSIHTGQTSLWRYSAPAYDGLPQPQELVQGVQDLQLLYGVDTDDDRAANKFVVASSVTDWTKVMSARLELLASSTEDRVTTTQQTYTFNGTSTTATDKRFYMVFPAVVSVRNKTP